METKQQALEVLPKVYLDLCGPMLEHMESIQTQIREMPLNDPSRARQRIFERRRRELELTHKHLSQSALLVRRALEMGLEPCSLPGWPSGYLERPRDRDSYDIYTGHVPRGVWTKYFAAKRAFPGCEIEVFSPDAEAFSMVSHVKTCPLLILTIEALSTDYFFLIAQWGLGEDIKALETKSSWEIP